MIILIRKVKASHYFVMKLNFVNFSVVISCLISFLILAVHRITCKNVKERFLCYQSLPL